MIAYVRRRYDALGPGLKRITENIGWLVLDRVVRAGIGIFVGIWVARYLGPGRFGLLNYAGALVALFGTFAGLGMDNIVIRELAKTPEARGQILGTAFWLRAASGAVAMVLAVATTWVTNRGPEDGTTRVLVAVLSAVLLLGCFDTIDLWFQSNVRSKLTVYARNAAMLVMVGIRLLLIKVQAPLIAFAWAALAEAALGTTGLIWIFLKQHATFAGWVFAKDRAVSLLRHSWPLILTNLSIMIYMRIDQIMIKEMLGNEQTGIYSAATRLSDAWYFIPMVIVSSVMPSIVRVRESNRALYLSRLERLLKLLALCAYSLAIPMTFVSSWLVGIVFGAAFTAAGPVLSLHIWAALFVFIGCGQVTFYIAENLQRPLMLITAAGAIINVGLNLVLLPKWGAMGAAAATVVAYSVPQIFGPMLFARGRPLFWLSVRALVFPLSGLQREKTAGPGGVE